MTNMAVIMENWNRSIDRMELLNNREYVENILGTPHSLNESNQRIALEQQLLLEGFWDTLKSLPGKIKELMLTVQTMTSNPGRIKTYLVFWRFHVSLRIEIDILALSLLF